MSVFAWNLNLPLPFLPVVGMRAEADMSAAAREREPRKHELKVGEEDRNSLRK